MKHPNTEPTEPTEPKPETKPEKPEPTVVKKLTPFYGALLVLGMFIFRAARAAHSDRLKSRNRNSWVKTHLMLDGSNAASKLHRLGLLKPLVDALLTNPEAKPYLDMLGSVNADQLYARMAALPVKVTPKLGFEYTVRQKLEAILAALPLAAAASKSTVWGPADDMNPTQWLDRTVDYLSTNSSEYRLDMGLSIRSATAKAAATEVTSD